MVTRNAREVEAITVEAGAEGVRIQWVLDEDCGAPNFSLRRFEIDPGGYTPLHTHPWEHEVYILSGQGEVVSGDTVSPLRPNDAVLVPPDEQHQFRAVEGNGLTLLCLVPNGPATKR